MLRKICKADGAGGMLRSGQMESKEGSDQEWSELKDIREESVMSC